MNRDERRAHFRIALSTLYLPFYDALCAELGPEWQPYDSNRTIAEQNALYAQGRTTSPLGVQHRVTNANGGLSAHNYCCANDWTWFDGETLVWLHKEDPRWQVFRAAVEKVGLRWGGEFGDVDHCEIKMDCDWPHVYQKYLQGGMTAAQQHIEANLCSSQPLTVVK